MQYLAVGLVELYKGVMGPNFKSVKVPPNGIPSVLCVSQITQLGAVESRYRNELKHMRLDNHNIRLGTDTLKHISYFQSMTRVYKKKRSYRLGIYTTAEVFSSVQLP